MTRANITRVVGIVAVAAMFTPGVSGTRNAGASRNAVREIIAKYEGRQLSVNNQTIDLFHGLVGHGDRFSIATKADTHVDVVDWLMTQATAEPLLGAAPLLRESRSGWQFRSVTGRGDVGMSEAHVGQFLRLLSEAGIDPGNVRVHPPTGEPFPLTRMVRELAEEIHEFRDMSFVLPVLLYWWTADTWKNRFGETWDLDRVLQTHLDREAQSDVCGGTHWCYALALATSQQHRDKFEPETMARADERLRAIVDDLIDDVSPDGWFGQRYSEESKAIRVAYHVHVLDWLLVVLEGRVRDEPTIVEGFELAAATIQSQWNVIPYRDMSHAVHAFRSYEQAIAVK